ncbi:choice-of-anchor J domain-containing protein [Falsiporphyromonas endometrii]|uniref:Choice-of-anchor J domain-containing protein n=1 Tax=Falsiporphyromonas endometrii TaxID=1387297 RepID=A0ABV9K6S0_9PORP
MYLCKVHAFYRFLVCNFKDNSLGSYTLFWDSIYAASSEAFDFGRVNVNEEVSDKVCFIYGEHLSKMPKIKVVSKHLGIFSVDVEGDEKMSRATVMLDTEKIGTYEAYLRVEYNDTNILYIPIKAIVQDPGNPYNLDDTHPIVELNETFDAKALIPAGWKNIAVEGTRKWMMRTTGGINANRYPAIDALGDTKGKVHALLVLPAIDFDSDVLAQGKSLFFKLATVKESGATLSLVDLTKEGVITPLLDITQSVDGDWKTIQYPIDSLPERGVRFLAFEYIGEEKTKATIYRIDDVKIDKTILSSNQVDPIPFTIAVEGQILHIKGDIERKNIILWSMEGCLITQTQTALSEISIPLPTKGAYVVQIGDKIQKVYVQ